MKVLWFTNTSSLYEAISHEYHGGGWIESLEALISNSKEIDLAICFIHKYDNHKVIKANTTYYPIKVTKQKNNIQKLRSNWSGKLQDLNLNNKVDEVIKDFNPDIINVFGTESHFSDIKDYGIPKVIHLQGLINPILEAYFPVNQSKYSFYFNLDFLFKNIKGNSPFFDFNRFRNQAKREEYVLLSAKYVTGRTHWDKKIALLYNPKVNYFHVDEVLRDNFYSYNGNGVKPVNAKLSIISTLSSTIYKGIDVVLKSAVQLKRLTKLDFQWDIIGLNENDILVKHFLKSEGVNLNDLNINFCGRKKPEELEVMIRNADLYVHPSYIDNSPNSVCEAQILGIPVIACNVGGVSSLIEHMVSGILVPSNGVFEIVYFIKLLNDNKSLKKELGENGLKAAKTRHDKAKILENLLNVYTTIYKLNN